jgi:hypothetical protein
LTASWAEKKRDTDSMCYSLMKIQYKNAPKMKISDSVFLENLKMAGYITMANSFIFVIEFIKAAMEQGYTTEEILGQMHIELKDSWDILATSKMGIGVFHKMDVQDILNSQHPSDLLRKSAVTHN